MTATAALIPASSSPASVTAEQLDLVKRTVAQDATDAELKLYLYDCQRQGVHPLDRLLHFTKRGGKYTPVTSIDLMRIRAAETNEYAGSDDAIYTYSGSDTTRPVSATVTVWRFVQGQRCAFTATARMSEYYPGDQSGHMWKKMPHGQLSKCAEALALRKGFPRQLAGLYAKEELDQAENATPSRPTAVVLPAKEKPAGFDDWWDDMRSKADEGEAALQRAWSDSARDYRTYLLDTNRDEWLRTKAKAADIDAKRTA